MSNRTDPPPLAAIRGMLLALVALGSAGTLVELLLLGHFESATQIVPLVLLPAGSVAAVAQWRGRSRATLWLLRFVMLLFVVVGLIGIGLHYDGNTAFTLDMYPTLRGLALIGSALTGATPVLAPGSMVLLGLIGLVYAYGHPILAAAPAVEPVDVEPFDVEPLDAEPLDEESSR